MTSERLFQLLAGVLVLMTALSIVRYQFQLKSRKSKEMILLNRSTYNLTFGLINIVLLTIWLWMFIESAQILYQLLSREYITNLRQLFNIEYMRMLRVYFFENRMGEELSAIAYYENNFYRMISGIIVTFCLGSFHLQRGWVKNRIYEDGVYADGIFIKWNQIKKYEWCKKSQNTVKDKNHDKLLINHTKLLRPWILGNKISIKVKQADRDLIEEIFKEKQDSAS